MFKKLKKKYCDWFRTVVFGKQIIDRDSYLAYLKDQGVTYGKNLYIVEPMKCGIDMTRPWLIKIGDDVTITDNVRILTHDYSYSVIARMYPGEVYPQLGKVVIGNNVFIGSNATVLPGSEIGDNVIIGAGTVVHGKIDGNCVVAGNPGKVICTIEEHRDKIKKKYLNNLKLLVNEYEATYNKVISSNMLTEFYNLYMEANDIKKTYKSLYEKMHLEQWHGEPMYSDLDALCNALQIKIEE